MGACKKIKGSGRVYHPNWGGKRKGSGQKKQPPGTQRGVHIQMYVTPEQRIYYHKMARQLGFGSASIFLREAANEFIKARQ